MSDQESTATAERPDRVHSPGQDHRGDERDLRQGYGHARQREFTDEGVSANIERENSS